MDRRIAYALQEVLEDDVLRGQLHAYIGLAQLSVDVLGAGPLASGLKCTPAAGLAVQLSPGALYSQAAQDTTAYSSVAANTRVLLKQAVLAAAQALSTPAPTTAGQSIVYLIEAQLQETDVEPTLLPFLNVSDPAIALQGPGGANTLLPVTRRDLCALQAKAGASAATGTQVAPAVDAGWVPLYTVTVAFGATFIAPANIAIAQGAPFLTLTLPQVAAAIAAAVAGQTPQTPNGFGALTSIASAATTDLGTVASKNALITGTAAISSLGASASVTAPVYLTIFQGSLLLTTGTNLTLLANQNIQTAGGDAAFWEYQGPSNGGQWRMTAYFPATGTDVAGAAAAALAAAEQHSDTGDAALVPRAGNVGVGPLTSTAPNGQFDRSAHLATMGDAQGGHSRGVNGWITSQTFTRDQVCGSLNVVFGFPTLTFPAANTVPAGTRMAWMCAGGSPVFQHQNGDNLGFGDATVAGFTGSPGYTFVAESDGSTTWWFGHEANMVSPAFRSTITAPAAVLGLFSIGSNIFGTNDVDAFTFGASTNPGSGYLSLYGSGSNVPGQVQLGDGVNVLLFNRATPHPQWNGHDLLDTAGGQTINGGLSVTAGVSAGSLNTTGDSTANRQIAPVITSPAGENLGIQAGGIAVAEADTDGFLRADVAVPRTADDSRYARTDTVRAMGLAFADIVNFTGTGADAGKKVHVSSSQTLPTSASVHNQIGGNGATLTLGNTANQPITLTFQANDYLYGYTGANGSFVLNAYETVTLVPDGGNAWFLVSSGSRNYGGKLQTLPGYPLNIGAGTSSYDLTWSAGAYERMLLTIQSFSCTGGYLSIYAFRDGTGAWVSSGGFYLSTTSSGGTTGVLITGANLADPIILSAGTGAGTSIPTLTSGLSGLRLATTSPASYTFGANGVNLSGV